MAEIIYKNSTILTKRQAKQLARLRKIRPLTPENFVKLSIKNYEKEIMKHGNINQ